MYKSFVLFLFTTLTLSNILAETPVRSQIEKVTLFRNGAQIRRTSNATLTAGQNTVIITNLPSGYDASSIMISTKSKSEIISIAFRENHSTEFETNPTYKALKTALEKLVKEKQTEMVKFETLKEEESLILTNKKVAGEASGLSPEQLLKVADIYRTRLFDVKTKLLDSKTTLEGIDKQIEKANAQINEWMGQNKQINNGEILIELIAAKNVEDVIEISYIDYRAYWTTNFDLRVETLDKPLNLVSKGKIVQNTGEDWKNVAIVLSTGDPAARMNVPVLSPWFLYYYQDYASKNAYYNQNKVSAADYQGRANVRVDMEAAGGVAEVRENITFNEFTLPGKINIPSDNKPHEVKINEADINAIYSYITIPKADCKVFLQARIPDWDQYNLSSGEVKLYFESTYVGSTYLDVANVEDTLLLSLGQDIAVSAKREKLKDFTKTAFLSSKKQVQSGWEITLKNNKPQPVTVTLNDQIPISSDSDMEISVDELSGGKLNKETGIVEWELTLKQGEQVKKKLIYTVKIPKDRKVVLN